MKKVNCTILDDTNTNEVQITSSEYNNILNLQQKVLSLTASDTDIDHILSTLCKMAEELLPNAVASFMLKDELTGLMYVRSAPSVPEIGWEALNGIEPGPSAGSCANAIYHGTAQYIVNTFEDERGVDFLDTAKAFNLCSCWSMPVKDEHGKTIGSFALSSFEHRAPAPFHKKLLENASSILTIVLNNEAYKEKIEKMAFEDSLTKLKNKIALETEISENKFYTVIFLDINNFSYINSAYGFKIGDSILIEVAHLLESLYNHDSIYRINADQFALKFDEKIDIESVVDSIQTHFRNSLISIKNINIKITCSYGAIYSNKNLLSDASLAIKKSKESGKNRLYIYDEDVDDAKSRKSFITMNTKIYDAFDEDYIVPYFQGIYDNIQKKITKYEALVRIVNKDGEITPPMEFLAVAKLSGLLPTLTRIMIDKVFSFMSKKDFNFSINITEEDLNDSYLVEYLELKSKEYDVKPYRVNLEILEGISSGGQKNNIDQLKEFKRNGYKISIDDFGAEYSNFERVLALDVDFIKIDARYIKNIDKDKKSYEITKAIVNFANNMQIGVVAEFVHSQEVQKIVKDLGIQYSQGFYFSEPSPELLN
jgi:diguanylate cyclase (GGDEF)-like protein